MFCQQCGSELLNATKFCVKCGRKLKTEGRISNKAMLLAGIAAIVSIGSAMLSYWPGSSPTGTAATTSPSPTATVSPSSTPTPQIIVVKATPRPTKEPEPEEESEQEPTPKPYRQRPEPTPDYPYRHLPTPEFPVSGSVFSLSYSSYQMTFRWHTNTASEAVKYRVRIERKLPLGLGWKYWLVDVDANQYWYAMQFRDTGSYRWCMTPMFSNGSLGLSTGWQTFQFVQ
jgi:hypothetical protein